MHHIAARALLSLIHQAVNQARAKGTARQAKQLLRRKDVRMNSLSNTPIRAGVAVVAHSDWHEELRRHWLRVGRAGGAEAVAAHEAMTLGVAKGDVASVACRRINPHGSVHPPPAKSQNRPILPCMHDRTFLLCNFAGLTSCTADSPPGEIGWDARGAHQGGVRGQGGGPGPPGQVSGQTTGFLFFPFFADGPWTRTFCPRLWPSSASGRCRR